MPDNDSIPNNTSNSYGPQYVPSTSSEYGTNNPPAAAEEMQTNMRMMMLQQQ